MKFGVAICHEGWRYPETVRWAAVRGAKVVFHPHRHWKARGSELAGVHGIDRLTRWVGRVCAAYRIFVGVQIIQVA